ncbi:MAG: transferase [Mycolicibacterium cosmeticum]|nr:transferase [Mycolicibacterium cosmeticum]
MNQCRGCGETGLSTVLDFGKVPAPDHFPLASEPVLPEEVCHGLSIDLCPSCGLAQLAEDDTGGEEAHGVEPQALRDQAALAVKQLAVEGWLRGSTVLEFDSPHSGTWVPHVLEYGFRTSSVDADVVLDCFGIMHEPDQRASFARRAAATRAGGTLFIQYQSITTILEQGQWNALRHGHFAYYSLTSLQNLLGAVGMSVAAAWDFDLYGGTILIAAVHGQVEPDGSVAAILDREAAIGVTTATSIGRLQELADEDVDSLRSWLQDQAAAGHTVYGYAAASKAVSLFSRAGIDTRLIAAVADASPNKQGKRMPGTDIPIISPEEMLAAQPDRVLLTLADLLPEVSARYPALHGKWKAHGQ